MKHWTIFEEKEFVQNAEWKPQVPSSSSFYLQTEFMDMSQQPIKEKVTSSKWKEFGLDTWLVELRKYEGNWGHIETGQTKHGFVHYPCTKGNNKAFGTPYALYGEDTCKGCGNVLPREARECEGYIKLMNAVQKYGTNE